MFRRGQEKQHEILVHAHARAHQFDIGLSTVLTTRSTLAPTDRILSPKGPFNHSCGWQVVARVGGPDDLPHHAPTLARTIDRWRDPIIAAILTGVSNATSEGTNRVIKLEGRKAYGFHNQRRRQRYTTTRTPRRPPIVTKGRSHSITIPQPRPG